MCGTERFYQRLAVQKGLGRAGVGLILLAGQSSVWLTLTGADSCGRRAAASGLEWVREVLQ